MNWIPTLFVDELEELLHGDACSGLALQGFAALPPLLVEPVRHVLRLQPKLQRHACCKRTEILGTKT